MGHTAEQKLIGTMIAPAPISFSHTLLSVQDNRGPASAPSTSTSFSHTLSASQSRPSASSLNFHARHESTFLFNVAIY